MTEAAPLPDTGSKLTGPMSDPFLIDEINECRLIASKGDPAEAQKLLDALQGRLTTNYERDCWSRAYRSIQEHKNPDFYGRGR